MLLLTLILACVPDDVDGSTADTSDTALTDTAHDTGTTTAADTGLVGIWLSQSADLSTLFAGDPFNYVRIDAVFQTDGGYEVVGTDAAGATYDFAGSFVVDDSTAPATVVQSQTVPYEATVEGIWQVDGATLTLEVVQTWPDYGYSAPTPVSGFGSTAGPNLTEDINVQTYAAVP